MNKIIENFTHAINKNRLSHLYLFYGSSGTQKLNLILDIVYEIFKPQSNNPHLKQLITDRMYPNLFYLEKEKSVITKDQIRELHEEFSKTSLVSGSRIFIINGIENISSAAANSLLKFLEEPAGKTTTGFLITDNLSLVLSTIISRSQLVFVPDLGETEFVDSLLNGGFSQTDSKAIALLTRDITEANAIVNDPDYLQAINFFEKIVDSLVNQTSLSFLFYENQIIYTVDRKYLLMIFNLWIVLLLDVIHLHINQEISLGFLKDKLMTLVKYYNPIQCEEMIEAIKVAQNHLKAYTNLNLVMQALAIKVKSIEES